MICKGSEALALRPNFSYVGDISPNAGWYRRGRPENGTHPLYQARGVSLRQRPALPPRHNFDRRLPSIVHRNTRMREMKLQDLKSKSPVELLGFAEENSVENASTMRKQELMFAILKQMATKDIDIIGEGVVEVLQDGFGFLRSPE